MIFFLYFFVLQIMPIIIKAILQGSLKRMCLYSCVVRLLCFQFYFIILYSNCPACTGQRDIYGCLHNVLVVIQSQGQCCLLTTIFSVFYSCLDWSALKCRFTAAGAFLELSLTVALSVCSINIQLEKQHP